jgi:hypothetical protein
MMPRISDHTNIEELTRKIMKYEAGEMADLEEVASFFQELINTGLAWELQGSYGRFAAALVESGSCTMPPGSDTAKEDACP